MAAVAGSSKIKVPLKASSQCIDGKGSAPISCDMAPEMVGNIWLSSNPHKPITTSQARYQRQGAALRAMRAPRT